jgi:hypothetical protein
MKEMSKLNDAEIETLKFLLQNNAALIKQYLIALDKLESRIELLEDKVMLLKLEFSRLRREALKHVCQA